MGVRYMKKVICPVDPTCTFWPKGQCNRPYKETNACWSCGQEVRRDLNAIIQHFKTRYVETKEIAHE